MSSLFAIGFIYISFNNLKVISHCHIIIELKIIYMTQNRQRRKYLDKIFYKENTEKISNTRDLYMNKCTINQRLNSK